MADDGVQNEGGAKRAGVVVMAGVAGAALLGAVAGVAFVGPAAAARFSEPEAEEHPVEEEAPVLETFTVENLVLNPAETKGTRFLMATVVATVEGAHAADALQERDAEIRDGLMALLGSKTVDELTDIGGRSALKEEIQAELEELASPHVVRAVYLPTFVIQ